MKFLHNLLALISFISLISCASNPEIRFDPGIDKVSSTGPRGILLANSIGSHYPQTAQKGNTTGLFIKDDGASQMDQAQVKEDNLSNPFQKEKKEDVGDEDDISIEDLPKITLDPETLKGSQVSGNDALIEKELKRIMAEFGEKDSEVPEIFLNEVRAYIKAFQTISQYRKFVLASLKRASIFLPMVKTIFKERGLPEDMAYIAFIESGFNPRARSRAGALGLWQFMSGTAQDYALKVNKRQEERLEPVKATYAAVEYFHDLIAIFGPKSFLLALAAYNCGEGKIISCLRKIENPFEDRNFWHIRSCLAKETREYPPKIIAAAIVGNNPEAFGFPKFEDDGSGEEILTALLNRHQEQARPIPAVYRITGSRGKEFKLAKNQPEAKSKKPRSPTPKPVLYVFKKGNTLDLVAEAFGVKKEELKRWNHLKGREVKAGRILKIHAKQDMERINYRVIKGDTLSEISRSFRVRPMHIVVVNGMKNGWEIKDGQNLNFYKEMKQKPIYLTVKKGAKLINIASKFEVKVETLRRWNNLDSSVIQPGQKLKIYPSLANEV